MRSGSCDQARRIGGAFAAGVVLACTACASPAAGGVYPVRACDAADGVNASWTVLPSKAKRVVAYSLCPSGGKAGRGLGAHTVPSKPTRPHAVRRGTHAGVVFAAPSGTAIVGIRAA